MILLSKLWGHHQIKGPHQIKGAPNKSSGPHQIKGPSPNQGAPGNFPCLLPLTVGLHAKNFRVKYSFDPLSHLFANNFSILKYWDFGITIILALYTHLKRNK